MLSSSFTLSAFFFAASLPFTVDTAPHPFIPTHQLTAIPAQSFANPAPLVKTTNVIPFTRKIGGSKSAAYLTRVRKELNGVYSPTISEDEEHLQAVLSGSEYIGEITFGEQTVSVVIDSGSSDTWLASDSFVCVDSKKRPQPQAKCSFGETYDGELLTTTPNTNFNISYGDGEFVTGIFGTQDITIGGITVPNQDVSHKSFIVCAKKTTDERS